MTDFVLLRDHKTALPTGGAAPFLTVFVGKYTFASKFSVVNTSGQSY